MLHLSLYARLMLGVFSLVPFGLSVEGLLNGWVSLPSQRPYTRRLQPLAFWVIEFVFVGLGIGLIILSAAG